MNLKTKKKQKKNRSERDSKPSSLRYRCRHEFVSGFVRITAMIGLVFKLVFSVQIYDILNYDILYNRFYIITQVILAFWLVLSYDVLKDRGTIDVVITEFFPRCFKMAERFEKLDNILRVWAKAKLQKGLPRHLNRFQKQEEERQSHFL